MSPFPTSTSTTTSPGAVSAPPTVPAARRRAWLLLALICLLMLSSIPGPARAEAPRWQWPLAPPHQVLAPFEAPAHRYGPGHRGVDLGVPAGQVEVRAVEAGTVRFSGMVAGRGVVAVAHADGLISTYEPVHGSLERGAAVEAGTVLGRVEDGAELSHCPEVACLHLGARRGEDYLDPMLLLGVRRPSVLLPWARGPMGGDGVTASTGAGRSGVDHREEAHEAPSSEAGQAEARSPRSQARVLHPAAAHRATVD